MQQIKLPVDEFRRLLVAVRDALDLGRLGYHVTNTDHRLDAIINPSDLWPAAAQKVLIAAELESWLTYLLDEVILDANTGPVFRRACQRALAAWHLAVATAEPYAPGGQRAKALILFNKAPFVDRLPERPLVDEVVRLAGRRVLVARGGIAVGKSHLAYFVRHLVEALPGARLAPVHLQEIDLPIISALDLMSALATAMNLTVDPTWDQAAQDARQAEKLARWLVGQTQAFAASGQQWVVLLDGLNIDKAKPALELVDRLIMAAARGDLVNMGLVVLALPTPVPQSVANDVMEQTLSPLTRTELGDHVAELARSMGRQFAAEGLASMETFLVEGLAFPLGHEGMGVLRRRLAQLPDVILGASA